MKIELEVKTAKVKQLSEEDRNYREAQRIIGNDIEEEGIRLAPGMEKIPIEFTYRPHIMDSHDIANSTPFDDKHVLISTYEGDNLIAKLSWEMWKATYEWITGENIKLIKEDDEGKLKISTEKSKRKTKD